MKIKSYSDNKVKKSSKGDSYSAEDLEVFSVYLNHLREERKNLQRSSVGILQPDNLLTALERAKDKAKTLEDEAQTVEVVASVASTEDSAIENKKNLIDQLLGISESIGALIDLYKCTTGPDDCTAKDWLDAGLTLATGLIPLMILAGIPGLNAGIVFAGATIAKEAIFLIINILYNLSDDKYDAKATNSDLIGRLNDRKEITEQKFKNRVKVTRNILGTSLQNDVINELGIINEFLDSGDTEFIHETVEFFLQSGLQFPLHQIRDALTEMELVFKDFAELRHDYFLNKKPFLDKCETDEQCGKGAAFHLINGRFDKVQACVEDQQDVIRTLPIFFDSLKSIKDFISAYQVTQSLWNILEKILKLDEYKSNRLVLETEKNVRCYLERITRLSQRLEQLVQIEGLCSPVFPDFKLPNGFAFPEDLSEYEDWQLRRIKWTLNCPGGVCNGIVPFAQVCDCGKDTDCDETNHKCNFPYLLARCWDDKIPPNDPNTGKAVVGAELVRQGDDMELIFKGYNLQKHGWMDYSILRKYKAKPKKNLSHDDDMRNLFKECPKRWPWQDDDNVLYALPSYCLTLLPAEPYRNHFCVIGMGAGILGTDWDVDLECPYLKDRNE